MLEKIEQKGLFFFTRILAFVLIVGLVLGTAELLVTTISNAPQAVRSEVTPQMVADSFKANRESPIARSEASQSGAADPLAGLTIPANLQPVFQGPYGESNRQFVSQRLEEILKGDRQSTLEAISSTLRLAPTALSPAQVVGRYFDMREKQIEAAKAANTRRADHFKNGLVQVGVGLALIALFSLVLVLLAIERNTHPAKA